jgi:hypothetical protein
MKYKLENNIDFYKELYNCLYENSNNTVNNGNNDNIENVVLENSINTEDNLCLISNLPLEENFVKLNCGHKFNYDPLYKDIYNHKRKFNSMEQVKNKPKINQIRCPYCRNIQDGLLPYYDNLGYPKENGVNFLDTNKDYTYSSYTVHPDHQCQYLMSTVDSSGNNVTYQCKHFGYIHSVLKTKYNDVSKYCYSHRIEVVKTIKKEMKEKNQALKLQEKNKKKEEKEKLKMELLNNHCTIILKTGKNKGTCCKVTAFKDTLCKRHYNLQNATKTN